MRYALARLEETIDVSAYRSYIADTLYYRAQNKMVICQYSDLIDKKHKKVDRRTGDEIVADIKERIKPKPTGGD